jgi:hypothetical protein
VRRTRENDSRLVMPLEKTQDDASLKDLRFAAIWRDSIIPRDINGVGPADRALDVARSKRSVRQPIRRTGSAESHPVADSADHFKSHLPRIILIAYWLRHFPADCGLHAFTVRLPSPPPVAERDTVGQEMNRSKLN